MKKFPWDCGDCPLLLGWDMSCDDMTYKCLWSKRQIDDCDRHMSDVCPMEQHDKELRNKTIEEFKERFTSGLAEAVRCAMCKNSFINDEGCDNNCNVNESMYKRVMNAIDVAIKYAEWMKEGGENNQIL